MQKVDLQIDESNKLNKSMTDLETNSNRLPPLDDWVLMISSQISSMVHQARFLSSANETDSIASAKKGNSDKPVKIIE